VLFIFFSVLWWRGAWNLLEIYVYPDNKVGGAG
jgi:hypothetical protein